jgi:hypothetical protein
VAVPNRCGTCNESFASDRDLQEHQESTHADKRDAELPESDGVREEKNRDGERIA